MDFRKVNAVTKKDPYPLPRIDELLEALNRAKFFTTLDLQSGFWQVEVDDESKPKTVFTSFLGLFQFTHMPFGLKNAPAMFQRLRKHTYCIHCLVFIHDIIVYTQ